MLVSGFERGAMFRKIQSVTKWGLLVFMPLFAVPLSAVLNVGIISQEGICLQLLSHIWFPALFMVGNVGLSGALLYLFVTPLYSHFKQSSGENKETSLQIQRVIRKNMYLTCVMVAVTTINVILFCGFIKLALDDADQYDYLLMAAHVGIIIDCFVMCLCSRMMTTIWLPARLKKLTSRDTSDQLSSNVAIVSPESGVNRNNLKSSGKSGARATGTTEEGSANYTAPA